MLELHIDNLGSVLREQVLELQLVDVKCHSHLRAGDRLIEVGPKVDPQQFVTALQTLLATTGLPVDDTACCGQQVLLRPEPPVHVALDHCFRYLPIRACDCLSCESDS